MAVNTWLSFMYTQLLDELLNMFIIVKYGAYYKKKNMRRRGVNLQTAVVWSDIQ